MHQRHPLVLHRHILRAVVGLHTVVDALGGQVGVQLAVVAVGILALEIVDAVGHVARLLYLGQEAAGADAVYAAGGQEEAVALVHLIVGYGVDDGVVGHHLLVLLGSDGFFQSGVQMGLGVRLHDVPHLRLAAVLALAAGYLVAGMHLDGEVALGIDKLDEQRKLVAEAAVVVPAHELVFQLFHQFVQVPAFVGSFGHNGLTALHAGDFPTLAHLFLVGVQLFERNDFVAAPDGGYEQRFKC